MMFAMLSQDIATVILSICFIFKWDFYKSYKKILTYAFLFNSIDLFGCLRAIGTDIIDLASHQY